MGQVNETTSADEPIKEFQPMNTLKKGLVGATAAAASIGLVGTSTVSAQPIDQDGLVNVAVDDLTVQVPVSVAANICGVAVNVLARGLNTGDVDCAATSQAGADGSASRDGGGPITQNGLVNVALTDTVIQVPVSVAANVCGVGVGILANAANFGDVDCRADGISLAEV